MDESLDGSILEAVDSDRYSDDDVAVASSPVVSAGAASSLSSRPRSTASPTKDLKSTNASKALSASPPSSKAKTSQVPSLDLKSVGKENSSSTSKLATDTTKPHASPAKISREVPAASAADASRGPSAAMSKLRSVLIQGGKLKADFVSQVESLDASRTGFVSSNELKRVLKQHGTELSLREMEALAMQFPMTHDKLEGISFKLLFAALSSADWKTWDKERVITWLSSIFSSRDEKDRSLMERVSRAFKANDIDGRMLARMTKVDVVRELGLSDVAPDCLASRIMREIHALRGQDHPSMWDEGDVQRWLTSLSVDSRICDAFSKHSINGKALLALTDDRLKLTIGVSSLGVRQRIVSEIKSLNRRPLPPAPGQPSSGAAARDRHMQLVLEKEFEVALADLSKAEQDVKEKRLAVLTYEQKVEESKRLLCASETRLAELKKNVESVREKVHKSLDEEPDAKHKKPKSQLDNVPTFKPVICKESRKLAEKFKEETMEMKLQRWERAHSKSLQVAIKIKDKETTDWEREVREKRMLDIARSELKLHLDSYGNATFDEATKSAVYDSAKEPNEKEKDERSRTKSKVFSKLLEMLNSEEIEGQKSKKESVNTAVQGLVRLLERGIANEAEKEAATVNVFLLLRLERKLASKAFTAPHHRPDPDAAHEKTPLEIAEEKRDALKFLAGYFGWGDSAERQSAQGPKMDQKQINDRVDDVVDNAAFYGLEIAPSERKAILSLHVTHVPSEKDTRSIQDINDELHRNCVRRVVLLRNAIKTSHFLARYRQDIVQREENHTRTLAVLSSSSHRPPPARPASARPARLRSPSGAKRTGGGYKHLEEDN